MLGITIYMLIINSKLTVTKTSENGNSIHPTLQENSAVIGNVRYFIINFYFKSLFLLEKYNNYLTD